MAMIKCKECGKEVSSKAEKCPHCGVVVKKAATQYGAGTVLLLGIVGVVLFGLFSEPNSTTTPAKPAFTVPDKSAEAQAGREKFIKAMADQEIFIRITIPGSLPRLFVGPGFYRINAEDKKFSAGIVLAYYHVKNPKIDTVLFYDPMTDKSIGLYSPTLGGLNLD